MADGARDEPSWHPPLLIDPQRIVGAALQGPPAQQQEPSTQQEPPTQQEPLPGLVFIIGAIEKLLATREARRAELRAALEAVMQVLQPRMQYPQANIGLGPADAEIVIKALALVCEPQSAAATAVIGLDCIEKLVSFRYFAAAAATEEGNADGALGQRLVHAVAKCFTGEGTADGVQLQIVKALFALLSSDHVAVRQAAMLETIRTTYNVFVAARSPSTQAIAQGTLAQMVHLVLERVPVTPGYSAGAAAADDSAARDAFLLVRSLCRLAMRPVTESAADPKSPAHRARCLALGLLRVALSEHTQVLTSAYIHLQPAAAAAADGPPPVVPPTGDEFADAEGPDRAIAEQMADAEQGQRRAGDSSPVVPSAVPLAAVVRQYLSLALSRNLVSTNAMVLELSLAVFELAMRHVRMYLRREAEVLFGEIVLPLLENKSSGSLYQRGRMLQTLARMLAQPALVVELYLNYDCSEDARVSVFQRLADVFCRLGGVHTAAPHKSSPHYALATAADPSAVAAAWRAVQQRSTVFNSSPVQGADSRPRSQARGASRTQSMSSLASTGSTGNGGGAAASARASAVIMHSTLSLGTGDSAAAAAAAMDEYAIRQQALDALSAMLQSMVSWSDRMADPRALDEAAVGREDGDADDGHEGDSSDAVGAADGDDPHELFSIKRRKALFEAGQRQFAWKAQKGIDAWRASGLLEGSDPRDLAQLLHTQHGLDKVQLGEYLGGGDPYNIAVMHAFVDQIDFGGLGFVPALRRLLQAFRLPGEAQMIDRFMLKFAERYLIGNPDV
ncbi:guanine nucleotide exchange protein for ADP-robosylation factor, partial [Coemansia spiralis]